MLTIFKTTNNELVSIPCVADGAWVHVVDPTSDEIEQTYGLGIPNDFITYPLDLDERPRVEKEAGTTMLLLRVPFSQKEEQATPYRTIPLGILLCNDFIITISKYDIPFLEVFKTEKGHYFTTEKRDQFILHIFLAITKEYLEMIRSINSRVDAIEDELQKSIHNKEVLELLKYQKCLELLSTALRSNHLVFEKLQRIRFFSAFPHDADLLEDVITENQQVIEMASIAGSLLSQMMDAFASIISNNQNQVIKLLTSVTIILSLPAVVSSLFGMNVLLPLQDNRYAFWWITGCSLAIMSFVVLLFKKRDWF